MKIIIVVFLVFFAILAANPLLIQDAENSGKQLFDETCSSCHTGGFKGWMSGAPEIGDWDDWEPYFKEGLSVMTKHINEGTERHEVKGNCEDCTEQQIKAAIEYIMSETTEE